MKKESGITLIALIVTVIIILIIAGISIYEGRILINTSKVQTLETNMLTIQVKTKEYAEEIESKIWVLGDVKKDVKRNEEFSAKGMEETNVDSNILSQVSTQIQSRYVAYKISPETLSQMGLDEIKNQEYMVIFSRDDYKLMDIIYTKGIQYKNATFYTLSSIQGILESE